MTERRKTILIAFGIWIVLAIIIAAVTDPWGEDIFGPIFFIAGLVLVVYFFGKQILSFFQGLRDERFTGFKLSDPFGSKAEKKMYERAKGEYYSGNYHYTIELVNELIKSKASDYRYYNLRAQSYFKLGDKNKMYADSLKSIEIEPDIKKNQIAYDFRNSLNE